MQADALGHARLHPCNPVPVASTGTWTISFTVGRHGIDDGGGLIVVQRPMADAMPLQADDPSAPGFLSVETNADARVSIAFCKRYWIRPCKDAVVVRVTDGSLEPGDTVRITLGDTRGGGSGWTVQTFPESKHRFHVLVDAFGTREYYPIAKSPALTIMPGPAASVDAVARSVVRPGESVPVTVRVSDEWGNPLNAYRASGQLQWDGGNHSFEMESGVQQVGPVQFEPPGTTRIRVRVDTMEGLSNPVLVTPGTTRLFWADMHGQTEQTVGTGTVEEYFRFARDKALLDVCAWQGNDFQVTDALWADVCRGTREFNAPGRFVTFLGYEWSGLTPAGGDHNILYLNDNEAIHRSSHWQIHDGSADTTDRYPLSELWDTFDGRDDVLAIAHVGGRHANLDFARPERPGLIEVHSHHGTFEWLLHDAIDRGLLFGVVGQSDDHSGRPGLSSPLRPLPRDFATFAVWGGYTGVYSDSLNRTAIWNALRARHCFATTGTRIHLQLAAGQAMMGDVLSGTEEPVDVSATVIGTAPLLDVELYGNRECLYRHSLVDPAPGWIRIQWSGVRIRSRNKIADWEIDLSVAGSEILEVRPYGFGREDEEIRRTANNRLKAVTRTSGDCRGLFLKLASPDQARVAVRTQIIDEDVPVSSLERKPTVFPAGGVNMCVELSSQSPQDRPSHASFTVPVQPPENKRIACWLRVRQIDGHMAWSSPLFLEP